MRNTFNAEAEMAILGKIINNPAIFPTIASKISPDDFHLETVKTIYQAAAALYAATGDIDIIALTDRAAKHFPLRETAKELIMRASETAPPLGNIESWCNIVKRGAVTRKAYEIVNTMAFDAYDEPTEPIQEAVYKLSQLIRNNKTSRFTTFGEALHENYKKLFGGEPDKNIHTGIPLLDARIDGIAPSDLVLIAGNTGGGKSALALQIAMYLDKCGKDITYYSQEMLAPQMTERALSSYTQINMSKFKAAGRFSDDEAFAVTESMKHLKNTSVRFCDVGGVSVDDIELDMMLYPDTDVIIIDHIGLMRGRKGEKYAGTTEMLSRIMIDLRAIALHTKKPIIALSQYSREQQKQDRAPALHDFKGTGEIETSASIAVLLWKPPDFNEKGFIGFNVAKNRSGEGGEFYMKFDAARMTFKEVKDTYEPPIKKSKYADKESIY
jgi:replicative DNA helicase